MGRGKRKDERGFSLVEVLVAMVLLGFAMLAMGSLFLSSMEHSRQGRHDMVALNLASEILERMRAVDFDEVEPLFDGMDTADSSSVPSEAREWADHLREELGPTGNATVTVYSEGEKADLTRGLVEVEILLSWTERGRERTAQTSTYLVRMGS